MGARGTVGRAHRAAAACLYPGAWAVDATVGNGHDTLFLAREVGPLGRVDGVDSQAAALSAARRRLEAAGALDPVRLHHGGHEHLLGLLPEGARGRVRAILFNLGFLPGGDKAVITRTGTTLAALEAGAALLAPGGRIVLVAYPGHPGGAEECEAVMHWAGSRRPEGMALLELDPPDQGKAAPRLLVLESRPGT
ncbi:MAG: class I SAM-dependent methyltransferase [Thiohalorhabdus sp.]|uniref:class I SAM-dependent methyltransferase n=1 Tax=Thiohalorhabdus sp. TaxID=3094134 RepID=UPI0039800800